MRKRYSEREWEVFLAKQLSSGLSQEKFCQEEGLAMGTFHKWKQRLKSQGESLGDTSSATFIELPKALNGGWREAEIVFFDGTVVRLRG